MDGVRLVKLSKASYRKMGENIAWAAGDNVFAIPLAAGVWRRSDSCSRRRGCVVDVALDGESLGHSR